MRYIYHNTLFHKCRFLLVCEVLKALMKNQREHMHHETWIHYVHGTGIKTWLQNYAYIPLKTYMSLCVYCTVLRPNKKNCYVALSRPTVKCEKTGSGFFFFFFFYCQIWAKNLLKFVFNGLKRHLYAFCTAFRLSFPHLEYF